MSAGIDGAAPLRVMPTPTDDEAVAIVGALSVVLADGADPVPDRDAVARWRWSGRWWSKPLPLRRDRPW